MKKSKIDSKLYQLTLEKMVIGLEEPILIKGVGEIIAKVDSGNGGYNVIHGEDLTVQGDILTFKTVNKDGDDRRVSKKIKETINVNIGGGHIQERPVVELDVQFGGQDYKKILFSVTDRSGNDNKVLISKDFVGKELDALIDVNKTKIADDAIEVEYVSEGFGSAIKNVATAPVKGAVNLGKSMVAGAGKAAKTAIGGLGNSKDATKKADSFLAWTQGTGDLPEDNTISKDTEDEIKAINELAKVEKEDAELIRKQVAASQKIDSLNVNKKPDKKIVPVVKIYDYTGGTPYEEAIPAEYKEKLKKALKSAKKLIKKGGSAADGLKQENNKTETTKGQKNESFLETIGALLIELAEQPAPNTAGNEANQQQGQTPETQGQNPQKPEDKQVNPGDVEQSELGPEDMPAEELQKLFDELKEKNRTIIYVANFKSSTEEGTELQALDEIKDQYKDKILDFCNKVASTKLDVGSVTQPATNLAQEISAVTDKKIKGIFAVVSGKRGARKCELLVNPQQFIDSVAKGKENDQNKQKAIEAYKQFDQEFQNALASVGMNKMPLSDASWKKYNATLVHMIYDDIAKILEAGRNDERSQIGSRVKDSDLDSIKNYKATPEQIENILKLIEDLKNQTKINL